MDHNPFDDVWRDIVVLAKAFLIGFLVPVLFIGFFLLGSVLFVR